MHKCGYYINVCRFPERWWKGGGVWVVIDPDLKFQTHTQTIYCEFDIVHSATCNPLDVTCKHTSKL